MENELKQLGLTYNERRVYLALLEVGETAVGAIIDRLKNMHRQVAYDTLERLEQKNYVIKTTKNNRAYFRVTDPKNILDNIKAKERIANRVIPQINKILGEGKKMQEIKVYEGLDAFLRLELKNDEESLENSTVCIISSDVSVFLDSVGREGYYRKYYRKSNRTRKEKNIKTKILYDISQRKAVAEVPRMKCQKRFINFNMNTIISIQILYDSVELISFGDEMFVIKIKNQNFREAYINYFNTLWKIAKK